nr:hypothetical protein [Actinomycetota bacterium]
AAVPGASFYLLVPATHSAELQRPQPRAARGSGAGGGDDAGLALARWRLRTAIDRLHDLGVEAEGQVGHPDPFTAVSRLLAERKFDEIILSTLPRSLSRWLEVDLPGRLHRRYHLPVVTIAADEVVRA